MPGRHVKTIQEGHEGFSRGDMSWAMRNVAEEVEWATTATFPGLERVYRGPDAMLEWMETIRAEWEDFDVSLDEVVREEDDAIVIVERLWGRGRASGAEAEMRIVALYRFTPEGKILKREVFDTPEEALAAL